MLAITYSIYWYGRFALNNIYSQLMIGFGLLNVVILGLTVVIGQEVTLVRLGKLIRKVASLRPASFWSMRLTLWYVRHHLYYWLRSSAIPLFGVVVLLSLIMGVFVYRKKTYQLPHSLRFANTQNFYVGMDTNQLSASYRTSAPLLRPQHLQWSLMGNSAHYDLSFSTDANQIPLLYLEPTGSSGQIEGETGNFLTGVLQGRYDATLRQFARQVRQYNKPLLVCFMPEFDNPDRPWGLSSDRNLLLHGKAWQYIVRYCRQQKAENITWIWCPVLPSSIVAYYPGSDYVDWLGFPVVDDTTSAADRKSHSFAALFQLMHTTVRTHPSYTIRQKPVMITRLGSQTGGKTARRWTNEAINQLQERYPNVRGVLFDDVVDLRQHSYHLLAQQPGH